MLRLNSVEIRSMDNGFLVRSLWIEEEAIVDERGPRVINAPMRETVFTDGDQMLSYVQKLWRENQ